MFICLSVLLSFFFFLSSAFARPNLRRNWLIVTNFESGVKVHTDALPFKIVVVSYILFFFFFLTGTRQNLNIAELTVCRNE